MPGILIDDAISIFRWGQWKLNLPLEIGGILYFDEKNMRLGVYGANTSSEPLSVNGGVVVGAAVGTGTGTIAYDSGTDTFRGRISTGWAVLSGGVVTSNGYVSVGAAGCDYTTIDAALAAGKTHMVLIDNAYTWTPVAANIDGKRITMMGLGATARPTITIAGVGAIPIILNTTIHLQDVLWTYAGAGTLFDVGANTLTMRVINADITTTTNALVTATAGTTVVNMYESSTFTLAVAFAVIVAGTVNVSANDTVSANTWAGVSSLGYAIGVNPLAAGLAATVYHLLDTRVRTVTVGAVDCDYRTIEDALIDGNRRIIVMDDASTWTPNPAYIDGLRLTIIGKGATVPPVITVAGAGAVAIATATFIEFISCTVTYGGAAGLFLCDNAIAAALTIVLTNATLVSTVAEVVTMPALSTANLVVIMREASVLTLATSLSVNAGAGTTVVTAFDQSAANTWTLIDTLNHDSTVDPGAGGTAPVAAVQLDDGERMLYTDNTNYLGASAWTAVVPTSINNAIDRIANALATSIAGTIA